MNKVFANPWAILLYISPALVLVLGLIYIPIAFTGYYGFMEWDGIGEMRFIGLDNYRRLLVDPIFWRAVKNSVLLAVFSTAALAGYLATALVLTERIKGADFFRKVYALPLLLSTVAIAQLWSRVYHPRLGILNNFLMAVGLVERPVLWLADTNLVLYSIFIPILWQYAGFYILIYFAALKGVPNELLEAARIDGASAWQAALFVKVPLIMNVIKATVVLAVVGSLKYFDLIYVMTGGGPNQASEVMASYMYRKAFREFNFGYGSAIGFALLVIALAAAFFIRRLTRADASAEA
ncbi:MAG TPA: sugar ABC transporter permease [Limnochordales bacterium]|nr:sugar ABC transporter permease [Limnochordales bacterium]